MGKNSTTKPVPKKRKAEESKASRTIGYYTLLVLCFVLVFALVLFAFCYVKSIQRDAQLSVQETLQFDQRITSIENALFSEDDTGVLPINHVQPVKIIYTPSQSTLNEAAEYLQIQYDNFVDQINFLFVILAIVVGLITLVIPIFNYAFIQKDLVERMKKSYSKQKKKFDANALEFDSIREQFLDFENNTKNRFEKLNKQYKAANEASLQPDDKSAEEIPAVSDEPKDQAQALYMDALVSIRKKAYPQAVKILSEAIKLDSKESRFYDMSSYVYHMMKRYNEALEDENKAIALEPENAHYYASRGVTLHAMKRYEAALEDKNKAIGLEPENAEYFASRGVTLHAMKRYEAALEDENKAIVLEPENARYFYSRGVTLHAMKRYEAALEDANKVIALESENAEYFASRGVTLHAMKRYEAALEDKNKAIALEPENARYYASRGVTLHAMKRYEAALEDANKVIALESENAEYFASRGNTLHEMKRYEAALEDANKAIVLEPENARYFYSRGVTLHEMKRYEAALEDANKAIALEPENAEYFASRGNTLHEMKRYEAALEDANKAIALEPDTVDYIARLARDYIVVGNLSKAAFYLKKALSLDATDSYTLRVRGLLNFAYLKQGKATVTNEEIQADFDQTVSKDEENVYVLLNRIEFFIFTKQYEKAKNDLDQALKIDPLEPDIYFLYSQYYTAVGDTQKAAEYRTMADDHGYIPEPALGNLEEG